jgi:hypothetical protein
MLIMVVKSLIYQPIVALRWLVNSKTNAMKIAYIYVNSFRTISNGKLITYHTEPS